MEANGRLQGSNNKCLWPERLWKLPRHILGIWGLANGRLESPNNRGPWRQTAGFRALTTNACGQSGWSKLPRHILGIWGLANGRLESPNKRGPWRQTVGFKALTTNACGQVWQTAGLNALTNACGQSAWSKLPRHIFGIWRLANGRLQGSNNKFLWPERRVEAAAAHFRYLELASGRLESPNNRGPWRQTEGFKAPTTNACGQSAWWKLPRHILGIWGLANGRLESPNNRGPWRQTAGFRWPERLVEAAAAHFRHLTVGKPKAWKP